LGAGIVREARVVEITYQLRESDLLALSDDFASRSPTARRLVRRASLAVCLATGLLAFALWFFSGEAVGAAVVLLVGIIAAAFIPARFKKNQKSTTAAIYREGKNRALFLPMTLGIDRDTLTWSAASGAGYVRFEYVERVRQTASHLFIYLSVRNAYIVPRDGVISGDLESFAWEVDKRWRAAMDRIAEPHEMHAM
jgi:hypothetical protein